MKSLPILLACLTLPAAASVTIDWVTIGDAGNVAQSAANRSHSESAGDGFGAVAYEYAISRDETTIYQYTEFLNAVAKTDTYGLYNPSMASDANVAGITRSGTSGSYTYSVTGSASRPVTYVNWFDAARFANWIHNGQPTGMQAAATTEDGAYTLNGATSGVGISRNVGATVWLPSENEWFKAAYYDPTHMGGAGGYWLYPTQSDALAGNTIGVATSANYRDGDYAKVQNGLPTSLTEAGAFGTNSDSYYGTFDQGGNVAEINDSVQWGFLRGLRGGAWGDNEDGLRSSTSSIVGTNEESFIGFRLAGAPIPEPTAGILTILSAATLLRRERHSCA